MTTTTQYQPVTIERLDRDAWDAEAADVDGLTMATVAFTQKQFWTLPSEHPAIAAWEGVVDEVMEEIGPQVRDLLIAALERRLPFRWEPERVTTGE